MKLPQLKLKGELVIILIGFKGSGKSATAEFLTDALWDSGIREIGNSPNRDGKPTIIICDAPKNRDQLRSLQKEFNTLTIRVRRQGEKISKGEKWIENARPDLVINNDYELSRFEYVVRDAVKNLLPSMKAWKLAVE